MCTGSRVQWPQQPSSECVRTWCSETAGLLAGGHRQPQLLYKCQAGRVRLVRSAGRHVSDVNVFPRRLLASRMDPEGAPVLSAPGAPLNSLDAVHQKGGPGLVHCQACQARWPPLRLHPATSCPCRAASNAPDGGFSCVPSSRGPLCTSKLHHCPQQAELPRGRLDATSSRKHMLWEHTAQPSPLKVLCTHVIGWAKHVRWLLPQVAGPSKIRTNSDSAELPCCPCHHNGTLKQSRQGNGSHTLLGIL